MNIFKIFKKGDENKNNQQPNQPEPSLLKLKYQNETTGEVDSLNTLIKDFKSDNIKLVNYDDYFENEKNLFSMKNKEKRVFYKNELDYLYTKKMLSMNKDPKTAKNEIEIKLPKINKITIRIIYTAFKLFFFSSFFSISFIL